MHKHKNSQGREGGNGKFPKLHGAAPAISDMTRLNIVLLYGFSVASGYSQMSRDRHHILLKDGVSGQKLLEFCSKHLRGSPMPGTDPISDGPVLEGMFRAAEKAGLVSVEFIPADRFIPERAW
jgi:hypothetical protein